ncbi:MAG: type ISP restriction/modification enzyme [Planctomycetaceae bacterium]
MPATGRIKPADKSIRAYHAALQAYADTRVTHEGAVETAFQQLLADAAKSHGWMLVPKLSVRRGGKTVIPDGTVRDAYNLHRGYWEAKDTDDDLSAEIRKKTAKGYPLTNTIFEDTRHAVLFQNGEPRFKADLTDAQQIADLLNAFYDHTEPDIEGFEEAVDEFKERVPELAKALADKIAQAHDENSRFQQAFGEFFGMCQTALNPNISRAAVDEMLVQHLLTERLIRTIFDKDDFTRQNVIAAEVEKVIDALVGQSFSRKEFLKSLDRFYLAIEAAARGLEDFSEKQHFLNTVYERFFQGYSIKVADTHGIVYTPQEIVDFMCASVAEVLENEFGKSLGDKDVHILDPCTGTGNFIVNLLQRIPKRDLQRMYRQQLFANEVMLLPYYIAALNIEHAYYERTGDYEPFEGLCFVDTLDMAEGRQLSMFTEENTARVARQKSAPITVIIGNPPYNVGQLNENDNNKNRRYPVIDSRVKATYAKDSRASSVSKLNDAYVKFFRWSSDRLHGRDGIVCFVSNNSFVDQIAFDGMRCHLLRDFTRVYHVHLEGNVRHNPNLAGTIYNVFGIQVGVGITLAIRKAKGAERRLYFKRVDKQLRRHQKLSWLAQNATIATMKLKKLVPDNLHTWLVPEHAATFSQFVPIASREGKSTEDTDARTVFKTFSLGVVTARDNVVFDFDRDQLALRVRQFVEDFNSEVDRYRRVGKKCPADEFVSYERIKWSRDLKLDLTRANYATFSVDKIRVAAYRPYCRKYLFYDRILNEETRLFPFLFPGNGAFKDRQLNQAICVSGPGHELFRCICADTLVEYKFSNPTNGGTQCFPFYVYDEDGSNQRENITDWALEQFRKRYKSKKIAKWDIFHYVYGVLHHPGYREKFADNLKRELPRIPLAADFQAFRKAGEKLAQLHLEYEQLDEWPLKWIETADTPLSYKVEKMKLNKDKTAVIVNPSLTLAGIPPEVSEYRLGNRSALDWVIDQYQVSEDKRSGIRSDPNRADDPEYIVRLVGQVVRVSVETVKIVKNLPRDGGW